MRDQSYNQRRSFIFIKKIHLSYKINFNIQIALTKKESKINQMSLQQSIEINVPAKYALDKTWQMHFEENSYTEGTFPHHDGDNACHREVHLKNGKSVRQKIQRDPTQNIILYQNIAGSVTGNMEIRFQELGKKPIKTRITFTTWAKTSQNSSFPSQQQLVEGLKNSKQILQANYRVDQEIPKCCQCKLFG